MEEFSGNPEKKLSKEERLSSLYKMREEARNFDGGELKDLVSEEDLAKWKAGMEKTFEDLLAKIDSGED